MTKILMNGLNEYIRGDKVLSKLVVGLCILLNNQTYKVIKLEELSVLLEQDVIVFDEHRKYTSWYKRNYVETNHRITKCYKK